MTKRAKKSPLTQEDVRKGMEVQRKRAIVRDEFFPALNKATVSIDEAKMLMSALGAFIMEDAMTVLKERKVSDIKERLVKKLCADGERIEEITALLSVFDEETLYSARELVEGLKSGIEQMRIDEERSRTLESLNPDWNRIFGN